MIFHLKQYDNTLLIFDFKDEFLKGQSCEIISVNEELKHLLPIGMPINNDGLFEWLKARVIPKNREFVDKILSCYGLTISDTLGIIKTCLGLSLNDAFWIVPEDFKGSFNDYNLYDNNFDKTLSLIAYTGYGSKQITGLSSSPELTTNGMLKKCWRRKKDGNVYLYKGGTFGASNTGKEPFSEFYASQIAKKMNINCVEYNLSKWKGSLCSICKLFTNKETAFVPIYKFLDKKKNIIEIGNYLKSLGKSFYNDFVDMLIFDAIIYNTDRHLGNFGLLVDNKTNKPIAFAPIFDNGLSLFNFASEDDIKNLENYAKTRRSAFNNISFNDIVSAFKNPRHNQKLRELINFEFTRHHTYNLPEKRLKAIENFIQKRVKELLSLKKNDIINYFLEKEETKKTISPVNDIEHDE